jgi:perosamine synthetase
MTRPPNDLPLMDEGHGKVVLFRPHVPTNAATAIADVLATRWIGQGPRVEEFEERLGSYCGASAIAVGSGTDALHIAYRLAGIGPGDEVIAPIFTCTATNIPLLYCGAKIVFADVDPNTLNVDPDDVRKKISSRTKALVVVHYGGQVCEMDKLRDICDEYGIPIIEDAAHALGASQNGKLVGSEGNYTIFSFQAIKHITTGDGGALLTRHADQNALARRLRWFGIDREAKQGGIWDNDITEIGFKYQMTDIAAAMGLCGLDELPQVLKLRRQLFQRYTERLSGRPDLTIVGNVDHIGEHGAWLFTIISSHREKIQLALRHEGIESGQVHYRNDRYSIFSSSRGSFPNMDKVEDDYLVLPLHTHMTAVDVDRVCGIIDRVLRG